MGGEKGKIEDFLSENGVKMKIEKENDVQILRGAWSVDNIGEGMHNHSQCVVPTPLRLLILALFANKCKYIITRI